MAIPPLTIPRAEFKNTAKFDVMVGGKLTNSSWVDTQTYNFLLGSPNLAARQVAQIQAEVSTHVLAIQGRFDPSGETLEMMEPAFRFPWAREPNRERPDDRYLAEVVDDQGTIHRRSFNALVADNSEAEQVTYGFFEVRVPVRPERRVVALRILDASNPERIHFSTAATESPTITITAPEAGSSLGPATTLRWRVEDPDSLPATRQLQVAYSHDGGESWVPLAVDVAGSESSVVVNTREVRRSEGRAVIRVFVSDGLNTRFDDVEELSTPSAIY